MKQKILGQFAIKIQRKYRRYLKHRLWKQKAAVNKIIRVWRLNKKKYMSRLRTEKMDTNSKKIEKFFESAQVKLQFQRLFQFEKTITQLAKHYRDFNLRQGFIQLNRYSAFIRRCSERYNYAYDKFKTYLLNAKNGKNGQYLKKVQQDEGKFKMATCYHEQVLLNKSFYYWIFDHNCNQFKKLE